MKLLIKISAVFIVIAVSGFVLARYSFAAEGYKRPSSITPETGKILSYGDGKYRSADDEFDKYLQQALEKNTDAGATFTEVNEVDKENIDRLASLANWDAHMKSLAAVWQQKVASINNPVIKVKAEALTKQLNTIIDHNAAMIDERQKWLIDNQSMLTDISTLMKLQLVLKEFKASDKTQAVLLPADETAKSQLKVIEKAKSAAGGI